MVREKAENKGLARAKEVYQSREKRVKELKAQGKKIIGYLCCYPPLEILEAADLVPYRIMGSMVEPITEADAYVETDICPYIRSCFDLAIKGKFDFLDGVIMPHSCEPVEAIYHVWEYYLHPSYCHYLNVPHLSRPASWEFFRGELNGFKKSVERFLGSPIPDYRLSQEIDFYNENRALLRELYHLRKLDPPLLSGREMTQILIATLSLPVKESNELLREALQEVPERRNCPHSKGARLLIYGSELDDIAFVELVEECGANVVIDDLCIGTRYFWHDVEKTPDPLAGLAVRYLDKIPCPRTHRMEKPRERYKYILDFARDFKVNGVIFYTLKYCDSLGFDLPDLRDCLKEIGLPVLYIEHDYNLATMMPLKTRVQAFVEMLT